MRAGESGAKATPAWQESGISAAADKNKGSHGKNPVILYSITGFLPSSSVLHSSTIQEPQILAQNVAQTENIYRKPDF